jgi:hypothetical protein
MCDKHSIRELKKRSDVNPDASSIRGLFRTADPLAPTPLWPEEVKKEEKKEPKTHSTGTEFQEDHIR